NEVYYGSVCACAEARVGRTRNEREAVDQLTIHAPGVTCAKTVHHSLRPDGVRAIANHREGALVLARKEVGARADVVIAEAAARVVIRAREEPPIAALTQQSVPHAAQVAG